MRAALVFASVVLAAAPGHAQRGKARAAAGAKLPRVLLLGDSVYSQPARDAARMLQGRVQLVVPKQRPGDTGTALRRLDELLAGGPWDLIHFNFGYADLHYRDPSSRTIRAMSKRAGGVRVSSPARYEKNLEALVTRLEATGAKLMWATTTPIDSSKLDSIYDPGSELEYNAIAARVMKRHGVAINDMHAFVRRTIPKKRDPSPFAFNREALHPPIVRRVLEELDLLRPVRGPVRVFVMLGGWSHIGGGVVLGRDAPREGPRGSLDHLVLDPATKRDFAYLLDARGRWRTRADVWIQFDRRFPKSGVLGVRYGGDRKLRVGSELVLGHMLGDRFDEQVCIFKAALGTPSLVRDLAPVTRTKRGKKAGRAYKQLVQQLRDLRAKMQDKFPDFSPESGVEFAGLVLNIGEQDKDAARYEAQLPVLIRRLRAELGAPNLPVVLVGTGLGGREKTAHPEILAAQQRVAALPEFAKTLRFVETRDFWPAKGARKAYRYPSFVHWFDNAESFCRMGKAIGEAMLELLLPH